jgi:hypothetical protein
MVVKARLGQNLVMGLFLGAIYFQLNDGKDDPTNQTDIKNISGCLFFISVSTFMTSINPAVLTFIPQRAVFLREENS